MGLKSLISRIINAKSDEVISVKSVGYDDDVRIAVQAYAIQVVVEILGCTYIQVRNKNLSQWKIIQG